MAGRTIADLFVKVLPDTTGFSSKLRQATRNLKVEVTPTMSRSGRQSLQRELNQGRYTINVVPNLDRSARRRFQSELDRGSYSLKVGAELERGSRASLQRQLATMRNPSITVGVNTRNASGALSSLQGAVSGLTASGGGLAGFGLSTSGAIRALQIAAVAAAPALISLASSAGLASSSIIALGPASIGAAVAVGGLATAFSGIKDAITQAGKVDTQTAKTAKSNAASRLSDAVSLRNAHEGIADAQRAAARAVDSAEESLANARRARVAAIDQAEQQLADARRSRAEKIAAVEEKLSQARRDALERLQRAEQDLADAQQSRLDDLASAEKRVANAQRDAKQAQQSLNDARAEAKRDLENLTELVTDLGRDEENAAISVARAQERLAEARKDPLASVLDQRQAVADLADAEDHLKDIQKERADKEKQLAADRKKGVEGSDKVKQAGLDNKAAIDEQVAAQKGLQKEQVDGARKVADAQKNLAQTRIDEAKNVKQAEADVKKTQIDTARDIADAQKNLRQTQIEQAQAVSDAERNLSETQADSARAVFRARRDLIDLQKQQAAAAKDAAASAGGSTAATDAFRAAMAKLSPTAQRLVTNFLALKKQWEGFRKQMQDASLGNLADFIGDLTTKGTGASKSLHTVEGAMLRYGHTFDRTVGGVARYLSSAEFRNSFRAIDREMQPAFKDVGDTLVLLLPRVMRIFKGAAPLVSRFSGYVKDVATQFANWVDKLSDQQITGFFKKAGDELAKWWGIAVNLGTALFEILKAALPSSGTLVGGIQGVTKAMADWTKKPQNQAKMEAFFQKITDFLTSKKNWERLGHLAIDIAAIVGAIQAAKFTMQHPFILLFGILLKKFPDETVTFLDNVAAAIGNIIGWVEKHPVATATLLSIFTALKLLKGASKFKISLETLLPGFGGKVVQRVFVTNWPANFGGAGGKGGNEEIGVAPGGGSEKAGKMAGSRFRRGMKAGMGGALRLAGAAFLVDVGLNFFGTDLQTEVKGMWDTAPWQPNSKAHKQWMDWWTHMKELDGATNGVYQYKGPDSGKKGGANYYDYQKAAGADAQRKTLIALNSAMSNNTSLVAKNSIVQANGNKYLQDYIAARRTAVTETANGIRATKGDTAAQGYLRTENEASRKTLEKVLTQMGWTKNAAHDYAAQVYKLGTTTADAKKETDKHKTSMDKAKKSTDNAKTSTDLLNTSVGTVIGTVKGANGKLGDMKVALDKVTGQKVVTLKIDGQTKTFKSLLDALAYQRSLQSGLTLGAGRQAVLRDEEATRNRLYGHAATGGPIKGPGTKTSDSIPYMLSKGEWVQPAHAVDYYGPQFMEMIRKHKLPKIPGLAAGGPVKFPMHINTSKTKVLSHAEIKAMFASVSGGTGTKAGLISFGKWLQSKGFTVSENPAFGGVTPGGHTDGSLHYSGNAIDVNHGSGTSAREQAYLRDILADAHGAGFRTIFMAPGHYNHMHVDTSKSGNMGQSTGDRNGDQYHGGGAGGGFSAAAKGAAQKYALSILGKYGWGGGQFGPLKNLWNKESGWNVHAYNKGSGAYGIPQALPGYKMASAGHDWHDNYKTQIRWGLGYIKGRYGNPAGAWAHSQRTDWYDQGGWLRTGANMTMNGTGKPEAVLTDAQWQAIYAAATNGNQGGPAVVMHNNVSSPENAQSLMQQAEFYVRAGRIR